MIRKPVRRRWIPRALVMLMIGAALTIAIAWIASSQMGSVDGQVAVGRTDDGDGVMVDRRRDVASEWLLMRPATIYRSTPENDRPFTEFVPHWASPVATGALEPGEVYVARACGWPWLALSGAWSTHIPRGRQQVTIHHGWLIDLTTIPALKLTRGWIVMPTRPLWPGLIGDTLFFTAIASLIAFGPGWIRRRCRRRRGLCAECGYGPLDGEHCPECGTRVRSRDHGEGRSADSTR